MSRALPSTVEGFFRSYFHEDWIEEAGTPDGVIAGFLRDCPHPRDRSQLAARIDQFADEAENEQTLETALFKELGCYYRPSADGWATRAWLHHVADVLRTAARAPGDA